MYLVFFDEYLVYIDMGKVRWITEKEKGCVYKMGIDFGLYCDIIGLFSTIKLSETKAVLRWFC